MVTVSTWADAITFWPNANLKRTSEILVLGKVRLSLKTLTGW